LVKINFKVVVSTVPFFIPCMVRMCTGRPVTADEEQADSTLFYFSVLDFGSPLVGVS
jgi:hypothetical protein